MPPPIEFCVSPLFTSECAAKAERGAGAGGDDICCTSGIFGSTRTSGGIGASGANGASGGGGDGLGGGS